jgi:NADH-quinone oxidoreductase E subunit
VITNTTSSKLKELMPFVFSEENQQKIQRIISHYPEGRQASAILPVLDLAQRQNQGWISPSIIEHVAELLKMPVIRVWEVASFYTMFNLEPVGKHLIQVCTTTPCWLRGSDKVLKSCQKWLGIKVGETTQDQAFTLKEVECLGGCSNAPLVQINDDYYEDLDEDSMKHILECLSEGKDIPTGSQKGRLSSEPLGLWEDSYVKEEGL